MPSGKTKSGRSTAEGQKTLLNNETNGNTDEATDDDADEWSVTYKKKTNPALLETTEERRRHESNTSAPRSVRSRVEDLTLEDTAFVDETPTRAPRINRRVFILIVVGVALGVAAIVSVIVLYFRSSYIPENSIIVIDAGSAHTKLHVFHYRGDKINGTGKIEQRSFLECNGTLLKYKSNTEGLRDAWRPCLELAKLEIPEDRWEKTEVYVGCTAGVRQLRLSNPVAAELLLEDVRTVINETYYPQITPERTHVMILDGDEEGALAWATVNFVTKRLLPDTIVSDHRIETYGSLDLGGSSTQVAFATSPELTTTIPSNFDLTFFGTQYRLYSKSFPCRGKGEALRILKAQLVTDAVSSNNRVVHACLPYGSLTSESHTNLFGAQCTSHVKKPVKPRSSYTFYGAGNITQCRQLVRTLFRDVNCPFGDKDCSFNTRQKINVTGPFMGFAGLYFVMDFFNLTDESSGVTVKLEDFRNAYKRHCETPWVELQNSTNPFMKGYCFDGIYIDMLLTDVYGFTDEVFQKIEFRRAVNGVSTGWAVGLALNSTNAVLPEHEVEMMSRAFFLIFLVIFAVFLVLAVSFLCRGVRRSCRDSSI